MERLRLVLLYALRYENDSYISQLKDELRKSGIEEQVQLVDGLLSYAGSHVRSGDLFQNKNFLQMARSAFQRGFKGVQNVYTQHKSLLASTVENLIKGKLSETEYPFNSPPEVGSSQPGKATRNRPTEIIVFMVGGTTYEEARDLSALGQNGLRILLGGTTIHNTRSFLADVAQLAARSRGSGMTAIELD